MNNFAMPNFNMPSMPGATPGVETPNAMPTPDGLSVNAESENGSMFQDFMNFQQHHGHFEIMELLNDYQKALLNKDQEKLDDIHNQLMLKMPGTDVDASTMAKQMGSIIHIFQFQFTMNVQMQQQTVTKAGEETTQVTQQSFHAQINISFEAHRMKQVVESMTDNPIKQAIIDSLDAFAVSPEEVDESEEVDQSDDVDETVAETETTEESNEDISNEVANA